MYQLFYEYNLESGTIQEKYQSKVFQWYRRKHKSLCDGTYFDEAKPPRNWGEAWDRTLDKTKEKLQHTSEKTSSLAHRVDQRLLNSKTLGSMWKKLRKADESHVNCDCKICRERQTRKESTELQ